MRIQASLVVFLVACGDGDPKQLPDAPPVLRLPIDFRIRGEAPHLLAIRDMPDGAWTVLPTNTTGMYVTEGTERHQIATVCGAPGRFITHLEMRRRSDDDPFMFCFNGETPDPTLAVTGQMLQPGQVSMNGSDESTTAPWTFDLVAPAGPQDLVAFGDSLALVRSNIEVTAATIIPTIDLAQGGEAYVNTTAIISNRESDEMTQTKLTVFIENGLAEITRSGSTLRELPASLLSNGFQFGTVAVLTPTTRRDASIDGSGVDNVTLLPRLSGIIFAELGATWTTLPAATASATYSMFSRTNGLTVAVSKQYLGADTELSIALDIPGYDAGWHVPATERVHGFTISDEQFSTSSVFSAPVSMASRRPSHERGRELARIARHEPELAAQVLRERAARWIAE